jgi:hypothetical protein
LVYAKIGLGALKAPVSHSSDPDLQKVPQALLRSGEKARELAKQTGTKFVVRQSSASALAKRK